MIGVTSRNHEHLAGDRHHVKDLLRLFGEDKAYACFIGFRLSRGAGIVNLKIQDGTGRYLAGGAFRKDFGVASRQVRADQVA